MKRRLAEDDAAATSSNCGRKLAKVDAREDVVRANAVNSPLLRLPAEIRGMILRMVVRDQLIHLFKDMEYLTRKPCPFGPTDGCSMAPAPEVSGTSTALEIHPQSFIDAHKACTDWLPDDAELDLAVFTVSRQLYQEAFPLFWRTSRFCLEAYTFVEFSNHLNELQRDNVRNLVVLYYVERNSKLSAGDWETLYLRTQKAWTLWQGKDGMDRRLRNLASFDIHLQLCGGDLAINSSRTQLRTILTVLRVFEKLGSRTLQNVCLTISSEIDADEHALGNQITQQQISDLSTNFRKRLTSGIERDSTLIDMLAGGIRKSEALADEFRATMIACRKKGGVFVERANECGRKADENVEKYDDLMDQLRAQLSLEIEDELGSLYM